MGLSVDLFEAAKKAVYHIDYENLCVIEEILIPVCNGDYYWYSTVRDAYLLETDVYLTEDEANEILLGEIIAAKKQVILKLSEKERELISKLSKNQVDVLVG